MVAADPMGAVAAQASSTTTSHSTCEDARLRYKLYSDYASLRQFIAIRVLTLRYGENPGEYH